MSFEIKETVHSDHLRVDATGECSLPEIFEFIDAVKAIVDRSGRSRDLIDIREVEGCGPVRSYFLQASGSPRYSAHTSKPWL